MEGVRSRLNRSVGVALLCAAFVLPSIGHSQTTILSVPWGSKPGQAGWINQPERERCGPLSFSVSGDEVFLLDSVNQRILHSKAGAAMSVLATHVIATSLCADGNGGVYIQNGTTIDRIDSSGARAQRKVLSGKSAEKAARVEGYGIELLRAPDGSVALRSLGRPAVSVAPPAVAQPSATSPSPAIAAASLQYEIKRMNGNTVRILGLDPGGKILVSAPVQLDSGALGAVLFKGTDANGNLYAEVERIEGGRAHLEVHRYSPAGKRLALFAMSNDYATTVYKKTEVAPDGSVYQMLTNPDGVRIIRYGEEAK